MGFFDKVKKALGSKKEDVENYNHDEDIVNDEIVDGQDIIENLENNDTLNDKDNVKSEKLEEPPANEEVIDKSEPIESMENNEEYLNENEDIQSEDSKELPSYERIIDEPTLNGKIRNFKYLDDLIRSGVKKIVLDSDIVWGDDEFGYQGIVLDIDDLTIDGAGKTIDGAGKSRIFHIMGKNIKLKNITFQNGFKMEGGAIYNFGALSVFNCNFIGNNATEGGAIYNKGILDINDSCFSNNTCGNRSKGIMSGDGGAIFNRGKLNIFDCNFEINSAMWNGGAVYNSEGMMLVVDSYFESNSAGFHGGAIMNFAESNINKSDFISNVADGDGGVIDNLGHVKFVDSNFSKNLSNHDIVHNSDFLEMYGVLFNSNESKKIVSNEKKGNLSIFNGRFQDNDVEEVVIYNYGKSCSLDGNAFEENVSKANSSNIENYSDLTLISPKIADGGKTIVNMGELLIKNPPSDLKSKIGGEGKVIWAYDIPPEPNFDFGWLDAEIHKDNIKEIILDEDICLNDYERDFYEGGIVLDIDDLTIDGAGKTIDGAGKSRIFHIIGKNIKLKNITFQNGQMDKNYNNPLNNHGGSLRISSCSNLLIENCRFIDNILDDDCGGGAIFNCGDLNVIDSDFESNKSYFGGVIFNCGELNVDGSRFESNEVVENGGAIYNMANVSVADSSFISNVVEKFGGGAICSVENGVVGVEDSKFKDNRANCWGGAIFMKSGILDVVGSCFESNGGFDYGGAIYVGENSVASIEKSGFKNNHGGHAHSSEKYGGGGAIYNESVLHISDSSFISNDAISGGAIINWPESKMAIYDSNFSSNRSLLRGGAISNSGLEMNIINSKFENNLAKSGGGAINGAGDGLYVEDCKFISNAAEKRNGGAIYLKESKYESNNCTFKDNTPDDVFEEK